MLAVQLVLQTVPESPVLQAKVPEGGERVGRHGNGVLGGAGGDEVQRELWGRSLAAVVGDGDEDGHQDVDEEVAHHHAGQQAQAEHPAAAATPCHLTATHTYTHTGLTHNSCYLKRERRGHERDGEKVRLEGRR